MYETSRPVKIVLTSVLYCVIYLISCIFVCFLLPCQVCVTRWTAG